MSSIGQKQVKSEATQTMDDHGIEILRQILTVQGHREVSQEDAKEIGAALIEFYELLATEENDELID